MCRGRFLRRLIGWTAISGLVRGLGTFGRLSICICLVTVVNSSIVLRHVNLWLTYSCGLVLNG